MLATLGKRDPEAGDPHMTDHEKALARRQAVWIVVKSMLIAVVLAGAVVALPTEWLVPLP